MRTIARLTTRKVESAKPGPDGKPVLLCDGGGLWLQVSAGKDGRANKSWIFRFAAAGIKVSRTGREYRRERQMGLGPVYTVGLADAREMARRARLLVRQGKDPLDEKNASRAAARVAQAKRVTFAEAAKAYLAKNERGWKSAMHCAQWHGTLRDYVLPVIGRLDVEEVDTNAVLRILEPIWSTKPETASRVRGRIETVLNFAGRSEANPARWNGHLEHKLGKRNKARTVKHLAALSYTEIGAFMASLHAVDGVAARALEFTILCATRTNETLGANWSEFDLEQRLWIIPPARTKRDKEHRVPLSDAALAMVSAMADPREGRRVFPIGIHQMRRCLREIRADVTVHGFRSTFRSWAGGCTMHPRDVCETALGHSIGNAAEQAYQRDALVSKRRVLMADWAAFCGGNPANVVRMDVGRTRFSPQSDDESADKSADVDGGNLRNNGIPA
jgi:integrase